MAKLAIGLPYHQINTGLFIALESILAQESISTCELIIVSDGCETSPIEHYLENTSVGAAEVRIVRNSTQSGLASVLNQISQSATSEYTMRIDSDDVMLPTRVKEQLAHLSRNPDVDVLGSRALLIDEMDKVWGLFREPELPESRTGFLRSNAFSHPTVVARTEWMRRNPYDEGLKRTEDKELWLRTCESSVFQKQQEILTLYRISRRLDYRKFRSTQIDNRRLMRRQLEDAHLASGARREIIASMAKEAIALGFVATRKSDLMYKRKLDHNLPTAEIRKAQNHLDAIASRVRTVLGGA